MRAWSSVTAAVMMTSAFQSVRLGKIEKVAIAMHCNLRPPNVAPVDLRFNYEAYNA